MYLNSVMIEVTRRCNLACEHCLRGDAQNIDMNTDHIDTLLDKVTDIGSVIFTGGEPSLRPDIIRYFVKKAIEKGTYINSFYIATNGIKIDTEFIIACVELYSLCEDKEMCAVELSNDIYHASEGEYNDELLEALTFYRKRNKSDNQHYRLIYEGRTKEFWAKDDCRVLDKVDVKDLDDLHETEVCLSVHGKIYLQCDSSFETADNNTVCDVKNLKRFYNKLKKLQKTS